MFNLCTYSRAAGGAYEHASCRPQEECPLELTQAEGRRCPCKKRTAVGRIGADPETGSPAVSDRQVLVNECLYPETFNGDLIRNPTAFAAYLRRQRRRTKRR